VGAEGPEETYDMLTFPAASWDFGRASAAASAASSAALVRVRVRVRVRV